MKNVSVKWDSEYVKWNRNFSQWL